MLGVLGPSRRPEVHLVGAAQKCTTCQETGEGRGVFHTSPPHFRAWPISQIRTFLLTLTSVADLLRDIGSDVREIPHG